MVKVKISKWARKTAAHKSEVRDIATTLKIVDMKLKECQQIEWFKVV